MNRLDKIMEIAEELSQTRVRIESTLAQLQHQLSKLRDNLDMSIAEIQTKGMDASLKNINNIQQDANGISKNMYELKQQSASLEQALGYIRSAKKLSSS